MTNAERKTPEIDRGYPFRVFISHKVSGHGKAAKIIKRELENYSKERLKVFVSPALSPGIAWNPKVLEEIERADLFVMLYLVRGIEMDWCLYEAGYFEREALKTNRKLICVTNPGSSLPGPLEARQRIEAEPAGIEQLLRSIFADDIKPVRPDLFDRENSDTLNRLIEFILKELGPVKKVALTPRLWITISGTDQIEKIKKGEIPPEVRLEGESDALREFGVGPGAGITLGEFYEVSEFKRTLEYYVPHIANALKRFIEKRIEPWRIPAVRVTRQGAPKVLVPAYFEQGQDNSYTFEFLVYEPLPNYVLGKESAFTTLYNLFVLAWQFRWRIVEQWLERMKDLNKTILVLTLRRLQELATILRYPLFTLHGRQKPGQFVHRVPFIHAAGTPTTSRDRAFGDLDGLGAEQNGGTLITVEIDADRYKKVLSNFEEAGLSEYIDARLVDAHELVAKFAGPFDFVFVDADKDWSKNYFTALSPKIEVGGCFTVPNARNTAMKGIREYGRSRTPRFVDPESCWR
jgi:hypothetical protein